MTTAQIRALIEPQRQRSQFGRGVKVYALEMLNMIDSMKPDKEFKDSDDVYKVVLTIGLAPFLTSDCMIYDRLLPRAQAERAKRKHEAPSPCFYAFNLQRDAIYCAKRMIRDAAVLLEKRMARREDESNHEKG